MKTAFAILVALLCEAGPAFSAPRTFAYVLQAEGLASSRAAAARRLATCGRDWIVLDVSFDGSPAGKWTAAEIRAIRAGKAGRRVLAYLSIGEAENYRDYWRSAWDANRDGKPDAGAPSWLGAENPDWEGNYKVRYWRDAWQQIVLKQMAAAIQAGFDGAYLDLVDAFEYYEYDPATRQWIDHRRNPETGHTFRNDMIGWVLRLAARGRALKPGFLIVPQNGVQLLAASPYRAALSAIGVEDLFTEGNQLQSREHVDTSLKFLKLLAPSRKPVCVIEYGTRADIVKRSIQGAAGNGFLLLLANRDLNTLGSSLDLK